MTRAPPVLSCWCSQGWLVHPAQGYWHRCPPSTGPALSQAARDQQPNKHHPTEQAQCLSAASSSAVFPCPAPKASTGALSQTCSHACQSEGAERRIRPSVQSLLKKRQGKSEIDLVGAVSALVKKPSKVARPFSPWRRAGERAEAVRSS